MIQNQAPNHRYWIPFVILSILIIVVAAVILQYIHVTPGPTTSLTPSPTTSLTPSPTTSPTPVLTTSPTPVPTTSPAPVPTTSPAPAFTYKHLESGETALVGEQDFSIGDVSINGIFEGITNYALIVDFRIPATVMAPFGADILTPINLSDKNALIQWRANGEKLAHPKIKGVIITVFNGDQTLPQH
jgi:hypothetical protein